MTLSFRNIARKKYINFDADLPITKVDSPCK